MQEDSCLSNPSKSINITLTKDHHNKPQQSNLSNPKWWQYFLAGELAGMCGSLLCHPFDTAKTNVQMLAEHKQSTFSFMRSLIMKDGIHSLYRGVLYPFFGFGFLFSVSFGVNGIVRNYFIGRNEQDMARLHKYNLKATELSMCQLAVGGFFAGAASAIFRTPIERVKTWSQIHRTSTLKSTVDLISRYGFFSGFWYGMTPTLWREIPQFMVYYPIYESVCGLISDPESHGDKRQMAGWKIFFAGASAGVGCWIVTYPVDVIKTRIQAAPPNTYKNIRDATKVIYKQGGYRVFWNGLVPTIYRAAALHSAIFFVYESTLEFVQDID